MPRSAIAAVADTVSAPALSFIVHSHLRWDFVWQRPQQLLSRLAATDPVLFVEEPMYFDDLARGRLEMTTPQPNLIRTIPHLPRAFADSYDDAIAAIRVLLQEALGAGGALGARFARPVQWFYTPMPVPEMLGAFGERAVVYDCMDELAQFRFAPPDISRRERLLLSRADVVFTGGYRLFESKSRYHDNVHFFGCGVDAAHFGTARLAETAVPADVAEVRGPVLGYFGVIDERLDYGLLRALAAARPEWTLLMVGPVVKVDPRDLPRGENIRWLGKRAYTELPAYVKAFDVCLMPFALNEATEYINPTKTLEYMAAGKPIVSTAVPDVVRNFTPVVRVARSADEFIAACAEAVAHPDAPRLADGIERATQASWESIVRRVRGLVIDAVAERDAEAALETQLEERLAGVEGQERSGRASQPADAGGAGRGRSVGTAPRASTELP